MWKNIIAKIQEFIKLAESMKDLSNEQKRAKVVSLMCDAIDIPLIPNWLENLIEPVLYGFLVDRVYALWKRLTCNEWEEVPITEESAELTAEVIKEEILAEKTGKAIDTNEVDAKFASLLERYGINQA